MDPFTQRMLERARARREKLNAQLSNAGHDVNNKRSPLKDANTLLVQATTAKSKTPNKSSSSPSKTTHVLSSSKLPKKSSISIDENDEDINKENGDTGILNVKSKLQRLGKLYSDDCDQELSSPIHRTEEKFTSEDDSIDSRSSKKSARLDRLAALASTINNWEDDLSHPSLAKATTSKAEKIQAKFNEQVKNVSEVQPTTSGYNLSINRESSKDTSQTRQLKWDKTVLENLEAQGFTRTQSNSRLVYDYKSCSQESNGNASSSSPRKQSAIAEVQEVPSVPTTSCEIIQVEKKKVIQKPTYECPTKSNQNKTISTPEKTIKGTSTSVNSRGPTPKFGSQKNSPHKSPGSVLSKASMFEAKGNEVKAKDPAQMSLSERMALFEKNKGEAPLIPKAPLTMSIPPKKLYEKDKPSTSIVNQSKIDATNKVGTQRAIFEQGGTVQELENNILRNAHIERQRELDMLRSRFNRNREMAQVAAGSCIRTSESSEGAKSNSPKSSLVCPVKPTPAPDHSIPPPPPPPLPPTVSSLSQSNNIKNTVIQNKGSPAKRQVATSPPKTQTVEVLSDVKRIRVSPSKSGRLYPVISEIEISDTDTEYTIDTTEPETATLEKNETDTGTEGDYYVENEDDYDSSGESEEINTSLGRSIMRVVKQQSILNKKRSMDPDTESNTSDISVLDEMDEYLDECLAAQESQSNNSREIGGPTPPKLNKAFKNSSITSTSFKYSQGRPEYRSPITITSPKESQENDIYVVEGDNCMPLMHSVSFYRKQQSQTPKATCRQISRTKEYSDSSSDSFKDDEQEAIMVQEKIKRLLDEVCKQQTIIGQASQALNLCNSTVEFSSSREQVEGERLLLVATHRRQAALNEIQRLKVEGTLKPVTPGSPEVQEKGSLTISAISLPLKREFIHSMDPNTRLHFVCLVRHLDEIIATPVVVAAPGDSCVRFPSTLKIQNLYSDFKITIEVYFLQTQAEILPHEIKYHIHSSGQQSSSSNNKKLVNKTPKKLLKQESRLVRPIMQSPAGPSAVRSPTFALAGYVIFSLKEVHRQQFTLNKVPKQCPLEGRLQMHVSCELSVSVEHRGFLTMFEDVSGYGYWHRRWCLLEGAKLSYWKYPEDERKKIPIGTLDLQAITTKNVDLASRDICTRLNTFLLETVRPVQPGDTDSLIMVRNGSETIIRYLLSADTKEERLEWCSKLNKTLNLIRAWGNNTPAS